MLLSHDLQLDIPIDNIIAMYEAERGVDFLKIENPVILPSWNEEIKRIVEKSQQAFIFFQEACAMVSKERSTALSSTHKVQRVEKEVDSLQDER